MPFDSITAGRVRKLVARRRGFVEKKMFGGIGFLQKGNLCCCVWKEFVIVRVGPERYVECLGKPGAREFDITGRSMTGWVMVAPSGFETDADLAEWVEQACTFVRTLPSKDEQ